MNQFKSIRELGKVKNAARNQDSMKITSRRYRAANDANKEQWAAHVLNLAVDHALLRDAKKGLLAQVEALAVSDITEETIIDLWRSVPREHQEKAVFLMNWATFDTLSNRLRSSPYKMLSNDQQRGFCLLHKPIVFTNDMPCIGSGAVPILYGDFTQVEVLQQGTEPMQEHEDIAFPGTVEVSMDGYAQVRLLDKEAIKGLRITT